jgi:hypothetical protein
VDPPIVDAETVSVLVGELAAVAFELFDPPHAANPSTAASPINVRTIRPLPNVFMHGGTPRPPAEICAWISLR